MLSIRERCCALYYQCRVNELMETVEDLERETSREESMDDWIEIQSAKVSALFERGDVEQSHAVLKDLLANTQSLTSNRICTTRARTAYMEMKYDESEKIYAGLLNRSQSTDEFMSAGLGLANIYISTLNEQKFESIMRDLSEIEQDTKDDYRICLQLAQANAAVKLNKDFKTGKEILKQTTREAHKLAWSYFTINSLYAMARLYQDQGKYDSVKECLALLFCYLDPAESQYTAGLIRSKFSNRNPLIQEYIQLDPCGRILTIEGKSLSLEDKPTLYHFIEMLLNESGYLSKERIVEVIWPDESYRLYTHNPRIADLARRLKAVLEEFDHQAVKLLTGRSGYRLSTLG